MNALARQDTGNYRTVSCRYSLLAVVFFLIGTVWMLSGSTPKWVAPAAYFAGFIGWAAHSRRNRLGGEQW